MRHSIYKTNPIKDSQLNLSIYGGMGDCITTKSQLLSLVKKGYKINISPNEELIRKCKENPREYIEFISLFMKLIYTEPEFNIVEDCGYKLLGYKDLIIHSEAKPIDLTNQLCYKNFELKDNLIPNNYIILHTKVRDYNTLMFDRIKIFTAIKNNIDKNNYKLVVMGERNIGRNAEYADPYHVTHMFSIYNDIKDFFGNNFIDYSFEEAGLTIPSLPNLINDCSIMSKAAFNICFGGGAVILASSVNKIVYLAGDFMYKFFSKNAFANTNNFVTNNLGTFIRYLNKG